jgi:CubicO group peptidase (beta-lactamase class C family)
VHACGWADLENHVAATPASVYDYASATKSFTAAAVLRLAEQGRLSLDDPAGRYLPEWRAQLAGITVRRLLDHTSGLADYASAGDRLAWSDHVTLPEDEIVQVFLAAPRVFPVGRGWSYTSSGYYLASILLERLTGEPFDQAIRHLVLDPAGLTETRPVEENEVVPHRARPYRYDGGGWKTYDLRPHNLVGAGVLEGTALDLARWPRALRTGGFLRAESYRAITTPADAARHISPTDSTLGYGLGVFTRRVGERRLVYHPGNSYGHSALFCDLPDADVTAAVLTNTDIWPGIYGLCRQLLAAAVGDSVPALPPVAVDSAVVRFRATTKAERAALVGTYPVRVASGPGDKARWTAMRMTVRIFEQNGRLMLTYPGVSVEELVPQADGSYRTAVTGDSVRFMRGAAPGAGTTIIYAVDAIELRGARLPSMSARR